MELGRNGAFKQFRQEGKVGYGPVVAGDVRVEFRFLQIGVVVVVLRAEGSEPVDREELMMVAVSKEMASFDEEGGYRIKIDTYILLRMDEADQISGFLSSCLTARLFRRVHRKKRTLIC